MINNDIELLAPCGKFEMLQDIINAGADAVYVGGKRFNMRMLKPDFNFSDEELIKAKSYLNSVNKNIYITINNLYNDNELEDLKSYLYFLEDINVDAIIIQDLGILNLHKELGLTIPVHASVQMGVANSKAVNLLEEYDVSRVILSKNVNLEEIKAITKNTKLGIEYFVHGDMCISHAGKCYISSYVTGESGNRGRCCKPCRWPFKMKGTDYELKYHLAHNDLCLFPYIKELIEAGVFSFKIEGRMRDAGYISHLVSTYRTAIDKSLNNIDISLEDYNKSLLENRIRNFTTGNLFSRPDSNSIGLTGEREPFFPSKPMHLSRLNQHNYSDYNIKNVKQVPELTVKIGNLSTFKNLLNTDIDNIIINTDKIRQTDNWTLSEIEYALEMAQETNKNVLLETPFIITEEDLNVVKKLTTISNLEKLKGLIVNDLGVIKLFRDFRIPFWSGYFLNVANSQSEHFLKKNGFEKITASLEIGFESLNNMITNGVDLEILAHGPLYAMVTDYCLSKSLITEDQYTCNNHCKDANISLSDEYNQDYKIITDYRCRNYLVYPYEYTIFNYLPKLATMGVSSIRIDGQLYEEGFLLDVVNIYKDALKDIQLEKWNQQENYLKLLQMFPQGLTDLPAINK
ncbi:hypothetical protein SYNTR_1097 [Candidatus Syntrophocurvum alkaliphilum]|uniref:Protease n=1 Tax=Candidatus Syntrophocurvum alkaliphilum TaxID=2293317 RepID=A0A6I6DH50_9FIRM|nr:U32 family peptidase [Candidatus Syntrophocurvum alkaliphilum]QGT99690.1 hypothetical protein SYNTR_1097 [Candidatus Syntrophocurvum alkaliphilum]